MKKTKVLLRVKVKDSKGNEHVRCVVKMNSDNVGILRIVGDISWWSNNSDQFRAALDTLKLAGVTTINAYINSGGGDVWQANEIANLIEAFNSPNERFLDLGALCCSAATTIAEKFPVENTKAFSNVTYMMHNPRISMEGEERDLLSSATLLSNLKSGYVKKWSKRMSISETVLRNKMDATWWLSQEELIKYNVVSGFIDGSDNLPVDTAQVFNKYKYEKVPAVLNQLMGDEPVINREKTQPKEKEDLNPKNAMKNFLTVLMVSMVNIKNYIANENASEAEVVAGLNKMFQEKEQKILDLTNQLTAEQSKIKTLETKAKEQSDLMIKNALDSAENDKKITKEQRAEFEKMTDKLGLDGLTTILNTMVARTSVKNALENKGGNDKNDNKDDEGGNGEEKIIKPKNSAQGIALKIAQMNAAAVKS